MGWQLPGLPLLGRGTGQEDRERSQSCKTSTEREGHHNQLQPWGPHRRQDGAERGRCPLSVTGVKIWVKVPKGHTQAEGQVRVAPGAPGRGVTEEVMLAGDAGKGSTQGSEHGHDNGVPQEKGHGAGVLQRCRAQRDPTGRAPGCNTQGGGSGKDFPGNSTQRMGSKQRGHLGRAQGDSTGQGRAPGR